MTLYCGPFSVADIAYFLTVSFATYLGAPLPSSARNLEAWFARVAARPSLRREAEEMTVAAQELAA